MMKNQILIALSAVSVLSGAANAQTVPDNGDGVQLRDFLKVGPLFNFPITPAPSDERSLFGPDMPPSPKIPPASTRTAKFTKLKLSVLKSSKGDIFQLEVADQSRAAILKKITDVMGVRAVIDPQLEKEWIITQVFRGLSWDDLLRSVNYGVEMVKSPSGTYFFADKPIDSATFKIPSDYSSQPGDFVDPREELRKDPRFDPFVYPYGGLPAPGLKGWGVEPAPQPGWEKREFNGHEFYYIPGLPPSKFYPIK